MENEIEKMSEADEIKAVAKVTAYMNWEVVFTDTKNFHIITDMNSRLEKVEYIDFLKGRISYWSAWLTTNERINGEYKEIIMKFVSDYNKAKGI